MQLAARLVVGVTLILIAGLPVTAGMVPSVPPGVQPPPIDPRGCDPVDDEERYLKATEGQVWLAYLQHGNACLNEGRYAEAIPKLERAVALEPDMPLSHGIPAPPLGGRDPRSVAALGCADDGAGRFREAANRWHWARRLHRARYSFAKHYDYDHPVGLEAALFAGRYAEALRILEQYYSPAHPPYERAMFYDLGLTQPLSEALHVAALGDPRRGAEMIAAFYGKAPALGELRYPRGVMLVAAGDRKTARVELNLAARWNSVSSSDDGPYPFQWSALAILEHLGLPSKR